MTYGDWIHQITAEQFANFIMGCYKQEGIEPEENFPQRLIDWFNQEIEPKP